MFSHEHGCSSPTIAKEQGLFTSSYCAGCYPASDCGYTPPNEQLPEVADTSYESFDEDWSCVPMILVRVPPQSTSPRLLTTNSLAHPSGTKN